MISYDNYKNRIEKLAKFKRILHKLRFVICGVLALLIGGSVALMVAKGTYTSDMTLSARTVTFNQPYEVTAAKAFLASSSEQRVEYRAEGGEWTAEKPVKAGKYSARTVTKKLVGYSYSPEVNFEIVPVAAEFKIVGESVVYGDIPRYTLSQLIDGHSVDESALEFEYKEYGAAATEVNVVKSSVKIVDENGDDFTGCYDFGEPEGKELHIRKRNITIRPVAYEFTYDAQPHFAGNEVEEETLTRLVNGDALTVTTSVGNYTGTLAEGAVNAGGYTVSLESVKIMHGDTDIGEWYNIVTRSSQLLVNRRKLTVTTGDATKVYDGKPAENRQLDCQNLIEGHIAAVNASTLCRETAVGTYTNEFSVTILDGTTDVSRNYEIDSEASRYGTLTITPRAITVTTATPEAHTYDGTPFTDFNFEVAEDGRLGADFEFAAVESLQGDTTSVGTYDNKFAIAVTLNGETVTDNFEIAYTYGKLTVVKRFMTVTTVGDEKVYDGAPLTYSQVTADNLADNQSLKEVTPFSVTDVTAEAGTDIDAKFTVVDGAGRDIGANYNINYVNGKLKITARHITVTTNDSSKIYDGTPLSDTGYTTDIEGGGLYNGDKLVLTGTPVEITDADSVPNANNFAVPNNNYVIDQTVYGTLTVEVKRVVVNISPAAAVYGEEIPESAFTLDCGELPNNEKLTFTSHYENAAGGTVAPETWQDGKGLDYTLLDAGIYSIVQNADAAISGGNARLANYDFTFVSGSLEITPRTIYYVTADDDKVYDGTALENTEYATYLASDNTKAGLLGGDELTVLPNGTSIIDVQERPNANYYSLPNGNYAIDQQLSAVNFGTLKITPRPITVYTADDTKTYDGEPLTNAGYTVKFAVQEGGKWIADDKIVGLVTREDTGVEDTLLLIGELKSITDVGSTPNDNRYQNTNYDIKDYVDGTLKIDKKRVDIKIFDKTYQYGYDSQYGVAPYTFNLDFGRKDGLQDTVLTGKYELAFKVGFKKDGQILNRYEGSTWEWRLPVGTYSIYPTEYRVYELKPYTDGVRYYAPVSGEMLKNYDIYCDEGTLTITPRGVNVNIKDGTAVYGEDVSGKEYGFDLSFIQSGFEPDGTLSYDEQLSLTYKYDRTVKDAGNYDILADKVFIDGAEIDPDNCNYAFTFNKGTLKVTKRHVKLELCERGSIYGNELPSSGGNFKVLEGKDDIPDYFRREEFELYYGDKLQIGALRYLKDGAVPARYNVGEYTVVADSFVVTNEDGVVETADGENLKNYEIECADGTLTIGKKNIQIKLLHVEDVVYGNTFYYPTGIGNWEVPADPYTSTELSYGEKLEVAVHFGIWGTADEQVPNPTKASDYYGMGLDHKNCKVYESDGVTLIDGGIENYHITYAAQVYAAIKRLEISYAPIEFTKENGNALQYGDLATFSYPDYLGNYGYLRDSDSNELTLPYGEQLKITEVSFKHKDGATFGETLEDGVGLHQIRASSIDIYDKDGNLIEDGAENYEFWRLRGTSSLEIVPREITVKVDDKTAAYGDTLPANTFSITDGAMQYNEVLSLTYKYDRTVKYVGDYDILADKVFIDGVEVDPDNCNYAFTFNEGTLKVTSRAITVQLKALGTAQYGGELPENDYDVTSGTIIDGDEIKFDYGYYLGTADNVVTPKNAGKYGIFATAAYFNGVNVMFTGENENYKITVINGELTVIPKTVTVVLNNIASVAYGETFSYPEGVNNFANYQTIGLEYGEQLEVAVEYLIDGVVGTPVNANAYTFSSKYSARLKADACKVYKSDGVTEIENGLNNYVFVGSVLENLKISQRSIHLDLLDYTGQKYGDFKGYPDEIGNYENPRYGTSLEISGVPYNEKFKIPVVYIDKDGNTVDGIPKNVGNYIIRSADINNTDWEVYDENGNIIPKGSLNYTFWVADGTLEIVPREITVKVDDKTAVYGDALPANTFSIIGGAMQYDEELTLTYKYDRNVKYVGEYDIVKNKVFIDGAEIDPDNCNYAFTFNAGTLTINKKTIYVKPDDNSCTYGEALPEHEIRISEFGSTKYTLPYGDELADVEYYYHQGGDPLTPRNAGLYMVGISAYSITNGEADVKGNYECILGAGELTIGKATLKLQLNEVEDAFYGDKRGYDCGLGKFDDSKTEGIKCGDQFEIAVLYVVKEDSFNTGLVEVGAISGDIPTNAAKYYIRLDRENSLARATDGEELNIEHNYNIICADVEFTIYRRTYLIYLNLPEYTYGQAVEKPAITIEARNYVCDKAEIPSNTLPYNEGMPDFDFKYELEKENAGADEERIFITSPVNAGRYSVYIDKQYVGDGETAVARANNYYFELNHSHYYLTINKKQIEITLDDMSAVYGDFEKGVPATYTYTPTDGVLEYTDALTVNIAFTEAGKESGGVFVTPKNKGTYSIVATGFTVNYYDGSTESGAGDKLSNYEIICNHGTLEIAKKQLTIAISKEVSIIYGESAPDLNNIPYTLSSDGKVLTELPYGDKVNVAMHYDPSQPVNAGTYKIVYEGAADDYLQALTNYDVHGEDGLLTVKPKEIEATVKGGTAVYGYETLPEIVPVITAGEMVGNEKLVPAYVFSLNGTACDPVNVGTYDISVDETRCAVTGGNGLYGNYKVTYIIDGNLEITASPLTVQITGDSFTYGERNINVTFKVTAGKLYHNDNLELTYTYINKESGDRSENPTAAGSYAITATAAITGGNASVDNYAITYVDDDPTLTITKRGIEITLNQGGVTAFTYGTPYSGDICNAQIVGAMGGQTVTVAVTYRKKEESGASAFSMLRARSFAARAEAFIPKDAGTYIASLDWDSCAVTDADGNAVDGGIDNYELEATCADVEFVIAPMALTVTVENAAVTYGDKLPAALDYYVAENMPYGESLALTFSFEQENGKLPVHVGDYPVKVSGAAVNAGKIDNYVPEYTNKNPKLTITRRSLDIQLNSYTRSYGADVSYKVEANNYVADASEVLVEGDVLTITEVSFRGEDGTVYEGANLPENVGTYAIVYVSSSITNAEGEDASADYKVNGIDGELKIDSSVITVYTASLEETYNGAAHFTDKYDGYDGDLRGYKLVADADNICKQIDATTGDGVDNTTKFKIVDESGKETQNLKLQYGEYGKLKVNRKKVDVTIKEATAAYGVLPAIEHTAIGLVAEEMLSFSVDYAQGGEKVTPLTVGGFFILPVGNYVMNYVEDSAQITGGQGKATNYELVFAPDAAFEVTRRHIAVTTAGDGREYNGSPLSKTDGYTTEWVVDGVRQTDISGLINGDELTVATTATQTVVGSSSNACTYTVSDNYVIDEELYEYGTLTVTQRTVTAKTADVNVIYDGEPHSGGVVTDSLFKLVSGHEFRVTSGLVAVVDVTAGVENKLTVKIVDTNDGDRDVTANYSVNYAYGKIIIRQRPLKITTGGVSGVTYDGKPHGNNNYDAAEGLLTDEKYGHTLKVDTEFTYSQATAGVENKTTYKVYCNGNDISANYAIDYKYGSIVIDKKAVTVTLNGGVEVQYGNGYAQLLTDGAVTLIDGETIELAITVDRAVDGVGVYTATADWQNSVVRNAQGVIKNGANNYAPEFSPASVQFSVIPREIVVTLNAGGKTQFAYGADYDTEIRTVTVSGMVGGETLNAAVTYNVTNPKYVGSYTAYIDEAKCTVNGGNIANYDIVACNDVNFEIVAKDITVYTDDINIGYGETPAYPQGASGYKRVEGLVGGDTLTVIPAFRKNGEEVTSFVAGTYDIICGGITVNGGAVGAENYNFTTGTPYGILTVSGIGVEIVRKTVTKPYDGTPLALNANAPESEVSYIINGDSGEKLPAGYHIELVGTFATRDGNVSSSCANTAEYRVVDEATGEAAGNYVVTYANNGARLEIVKKAIEITTDTPEARAYNGQPLTAGYTFDETQLIEGHVLSANNRASQKDVGSTANTMTFTITANGADVTANYQINATYGTLTVNKLAVSVEIESVTKAYGENYGVGSINRKNLVNDEILFYRLQLEKDGEPCDTSKPLSAGTYEIVCKEGDASVSGGNITNYDITFSDGSTLTVTPRQIRIYTANAEAEYSGQPLSRTDGYTTKWIKDDVEQNESGLINGDTLTVVTFASQTEVGSRKNECTYVLSDNAGNYEIAGYECGTLTVTKIALKVTTNGINGVYKGSPYSDGGFSYDDKLLDGHTIALSGSVPQFTDVVSGAKNEFKVAITANGEDVTEKYYEISYTYGDVNITKAALTLTPNDPHRTFDYGFGNFDAQFKPVAADNLVGNDSLTTVALVYIAEDGSVLDGEPVNAGKYKVKVNLAGSVISSADGVNRTDNYAVTCEEVTFTVARRKITVSLTAWADETYNGETHTYAGNCEITDGTLLGGETITSFVVAYYTDAEKNNSVAAPKDADTYYVFPDVSASKVRGANGEFAIGQNYEVTCSHIEFTINPKDLVIELEDVSHTYDGAVYDYAGCGGMTTNLCDGDEIQCNITYSGNHRDAGAYTVTFNENLVFTSGNAANYVLDKTNSKLTCELTISERTIIVWVDDRDVEKGSGEYTYAHITSSSAGDEGFVGNDLENAELTFRYFDESNTELEGMPATVGTYTVTAAFGGDVMKNYVVQRINTGTLKVTERKVRVTPVFNGTRPYYYDGNPVDGGLFGFVHVHSPEGAPTEEAGFGGDDLNNIKAVYTFTDLSSGKEYIGTTPANAGMYRISVKLTTLSGDDVEGYEITYRNGYFTVEKRPLSYTVNVTGAGEYVYSNSRPAFSAELADGYDGFINDNALPEHTFELFAGDKPITRYNVGTYQVRMAFEGMENYAITATTATVKIVPRTIVITPVDPYNGVAQLYNGTGLRLGANDREIVSKVNENGDLAAGDELTISSTVFNPGAYTVKGRLEIAEVFITSGGADVSGNYKYYYQYDATNEAIKSLNLLAKDFRVDVSYQQSVIHYEFGDLGQTVYSYTGAAVPKHLDADTVKLADGNSLKFGHVLGLSKYDVNVPAAAGDYPDLIRDLVKVYDASRNNVSAIYILTCDNPEAGEIKVAKNVLDVQFNGMTADSLTAGKLGLEVSGLFTGTTPAHQAEVYAFNLDGSWLVGVTVFSESDAGKRTDLSANYELDGNCKLDGATVRIITLDEEELYKRPSIGVEITVTESELAGGKGTLYEFDGESRWVLKGGYTVSGVDALEKNGHKLQVLVFREGGRYLLGVTVYSETNGRRSDARSTYRLKDLITSGVAARYIASSEAANMQREIYIDFSEAFNADGTPKTENGLLTGYSYKGLSDGHKIEVTVTEKDGKYEIGVEIFTVNASGRKLNKNTVYELKAVVPDGVTAGIIDGNLN